MNILLSTSIICTLFTMSHGFLNKNFLSRASTSKFQQQSEGRLWAKKQNNNKNTSFDMKELKQRINEVNNPYHDMFTSTSAAADSGERPEEVYVILYQPNTEEEGLHSIEYPKGSGNNIILAFESQDACNKFADTLKAQNPAFVDDDNNHPVIISPQLSFLDSLETLCESLGVFVEVVPEGTEVVPPTQNVQNLGQHNPHLRETKNHLDYLFDMFEMEAAEELGMTAAASSNSVGAWE